MNKNWKQNKLRFGMLNLLMLMGKMEEFIDMMRDRDTLGLRRDEMKGMGEKELRGGVKW